MVFTPQWCGYHWSLKGQIPSAEILILYSGISSWHPEAFWCTWFMDHSEEHGFIGQTESQLLIKETEAGLCLCSTPPDGHSRNHSTLNNSVPHLHALVLAFPSSDTFPPSVWQTLFQSQLKFSCFFTPIHLLAPEPWLTLKVAWFFTPLSPTLWPPIG
jgi:hypothetical protein